MYGAPTFGASQGYSMGMSQAQGQAQEGKKRLDEKSSCLPVTIRAIENSIAQMASTGGELTIFGQEPSMVILVAAVEEANKQTTSMELMLNDGTGRLKARYFVSDDSAGKAMEEIVAGKYVHVFGNVRTAPMNHLSILGFRPVTSADEVSHHTIEVAHTYLSLLKGKSDPSTPSPKKISQPTPATAEAPAAMATDTLSPPKAAEVPVPEAAAPVTDLKAALFAYLEKESPSRGETGLALAEVLKHFSPKPEDEVKKTLADLVEDGEVFTTIDDEHFSSSI
mmetsp:Transcript_12929/g.22861  ORF Transcript_12929/g.22861 Transcript_12929/m.22861 type:complete len:280 (+) Transcript_12929:63-902(+)